ncbi:MAG: UDP-N-acetylglucosamine 2-epimerase (non-hydrolyzing) [Bacteroidetes bacterium]|nr:UDP-N-acetylglucosamine 2-epimerase (non-hydrolyzing) [Bacteroidota bacterium]
MKKIAFIFGTRPEAIKLAPVILEMKKSQDFQVEVCVTAQHREMLDQVLEIFGIKPETDLDLMQPDQSLATFAARAIVHVDEYLKKSKPGMILVQGDTTTVFAAALAAFYNHIPIGHVEAGLRTGNIYSPFPEEVNRRLATHLASVHFAPTEGNRMNLLREGISVERIHVTGNTVIDALLLAKEKVMVEVPRVEGLEGIRLGDQRIVLITGHRRESFGKGFENICNAIYRLAQDFPDVRFIYPVHLNPNVREPVYRILKQNSSPNIHLIPPVSYLPFVYLMNLSTLILTDSGGIQEEGPGLNKPVLVMREVTERPEGVETGAVSLVGTNLLGIVDAVSTLLNDPIKYSRMANSVNPYGDGKASERIVRVLRDFPL